MLDAKLGAVFLTPSAAFLLQLHAAFKDNVLRLPYAS